SPPRSLLSSSPPAPPPPPGPPRLPWDFLIVDECHNLMPSPFGDDSELCHMLRIIAPLFEHKLFLSATPHNGHTRSFTGLLEMLDPVRFTRSNELTPATRRRVRDVVVRRLKRDINGIGQKRFCTRRAPEGLMLAPDSREAALTAAFAEFRRTVRTLIADRSRSHRRAGAFAVEILGKRLLSCPTAFAESWRRAQQGLREEGVATETEVIAAQRAVRQETGDDREAAQREATAATVAGAWLKALATDLAAPMAALQRALDDLGFDLDDQTPTVAQTPRADARFDALLALIKRTLLEGDEFREDERLIVFTEYKTTLDYLARRLRECFAEERILTLYGSGSAEGMGDVERSHVKAAFNDPSAPVRILVATDAASEGLNLHRTARYLLHYDCPWNPSRLEQRNGRLDRYGQARDVTVHHFVSEADADLQFLAHVIHKADEIREDLGSVNEVFDRAAHQRLIEGEDAATVRQTLDAHLDANQGRAAIDADDRMAIDDGSGHDSTLEALAAEIDLDPGAFGETLESAMAIPAGRPQLKVTEERATYRIIRPDLPQWRKVIDDSVRRDAPNGVKGPVPLLAFSPEPFIERLGELSVFSPRRDALLMHLAHPMMQRALTVLSRRRYPGGETAEKASRWTVRRGGVPSGADAMVLLSVEELAVNRLRETFHRWVRTLALSVRDGELGEPLPHVPAYRLRGGRDARSPTDTTLANELLEDVESGLKAVLKGHREALTQTLRQQLQTDGQAARATEDERYRERQGEVSALIEQTTSARLEREIEQLKFQRAQGALFDGDEQLTGIDRSIEEKQREIERRRHHYEDIRGQLRRERERILDHLLPARYALAGEVQVFPVTVEVRLP
ncbi:MAG: helicase-related protein, partial [Gammaproteobacteria bacterium]|nr:helicase-related protein [Gammaproteobacteria bacterium]